MPTSPLPADSSSNPESSTLQSPAIAENAICYIFAVLFFTLGSRLAIAQLLELSPFVRASIIPVSHAFFASLGVCIFVIFDLRLKRLHKQQYLLMMFFLLALFSQLPSIHTSPVIMLVGWLGDFSFFAVCVILIANTDPFRVFYSAAGALFWATILTSAVTLFQIDWTAVSWINYNRLSGYQDVIDGNVLATQSAYSALCGLALLQRYSSLVIKCIIIAGLFLLLVVILLAVTKAVFLAITAVVLVLIVTIQLRAKIFLIVFTIVMYLVLKDTIFDTAITSHIYKYISYGSLGTLTNRTIIWHAAMADFSTYFEIFFGHGYNAISGIKFTGLGEMVRVYHFHNEFINSLWSVGAVGTLFLLIPFYWQLVSMALRFGTWTKRDDLVSSENTVLFWMFCILIFYFIMGIASTMLGFTNLTFLLFLFNFCVYCEVRVRSGSRYATASRT